MKLLLPAPVSPVKVRAILYYIVHFEGKKKAMDFYLKECKL